MYKPWHPRLMHVTVTVHVHVTQRHARRGNAGYRIKEHETKKGAVERNDIETRDGADVWREENNIIEESRGKRTGRKRAVEQRFAEGGSSFTCCCCIVLQCGLVFLQLYFTAPVEQCVVLLPRGHWGNCLLSSLALHLHYKTKQCNWFPICSCEKLNHIQM